MIPQNIVQVLAYRGLPGGVAFFVEYRVSNERYAKRPVLPLLNFLCTHVHPQFMGSSVRSANRRNQPPRASLSCDTRWTRKYRPRTPGFIEPVDRPSSVAAAVARFPSENAMFAALSVAAWAEVCPADRGACDHVFPLPYISLLAVCVGSNYDEGIGHGVTRGGRFLGKGRVFGGAELSCYVPDRMSVFKDSTSETDSSRFSRNNGIRIFVISASFIICENSNSKLSFVSGDTFQSSFRSDPAAEIVLVIETDQIDVPAHLLDKLAVGSEETSLRKTYDCNVYVRAIVKITLNERTKIYTSRHPYRRRISLASSMSFRVRASA